MVEEPSVWRLPPLTGPGGEVDFGPDRKAPLRLACVAPAGRGVRISTVVVMGFIDGKTTCEATYRKQASVLVQIGLIDPARMRTADSAQAQRWLGLALP